MQKDKRINGKCVFVAHCKRKVRRCVLRKKVSVKRFFFSFFLFVTVQKDKLLDEKMQCASPSPNQHHRDGCLSVTLDIRGFRLPCEHIKGSNEKHIKSSKEKHIKGSTQLNQKHISDLAFHLIFHRFSPFKFCLRVVL